MVSSILLLMIGLSDLIGGARRVHPLAGRGVVLVGVSLLAVFGLGAHWWAVAGSVLLAVGWIMAMSRPSGSTRRGKNPRLWPVVVLFVTLVGITAYDRTGSTASGFLVDAYSLIALDAARAIPLATVMAAVAVGVFLTRSSNIITLAALGRSHQEADAAAAMGEAPISGDLEQAHSRNRWELFIRGTRVASIRTGEPASSGPALKGGRLIGPLERLLIVVLAFSGAPAIIAALAAAKGIVRFPEIAEDKGSGSKAEEFLVGSLASWTLSVFAVLYLHLSLLN